MFWLFSCIFHIPPDTNQSSISEPDLAYLHQDNLLFETVDISYTYPKHLSKDLPLSLKNHFDFFDESPEVWVPRPPRTPTKFILPQKIEQAQTSQPLEKNEAQHTLKNIERIHLSASKNITSSDIQLFLPSTPKKFVQEEETLFIVKTAPKTVLEWTFRWNNTNFSNTTVSDRFGNTQVRWSIESNLIHPAPLNIEIKSYSENTQTSQKTKISKEIMVFPNHFFVEPRLEENNLYIDVFDFLNKESQTTPVNISYQHRKKTKFCMLPCNFKKLLRQKTEEITVSYSDDLFREAAQKFRIPDLQPIYEINIDMQADTTSVQDNLQGDLSLHVPQNIHVSDDFWGVIYLENLPNKIIDIAVVDDLRQNTLLQGSFKTTEQFHSIPIKIPPYTSNISLFYSIDDQHKKISYPLQIKQEFQSIHQKIPWEVFFDKEETRNSIQFLFSNNEWGHVFFSRYEYIDIMFHLLQWHDAPATVDVQWQRLLLGSLLWEGFYYGDVPIFINFRKQVAIDHLELLENVRQGLEDPFVFLALLVAQERGFYIPFDVFSIIKTKILQKQDSALHVYLTFLIAPTSLHIQSPKEKAKKLYSTATPSEKIWLLPILHRKYSEELEVEIKKNILPYLSTEEKGQLVMTLRKVENMYNLSYQGRTNLKNNTFWELVGISFFLQRRKRYEESEIEIDIRENYTHILDGTLRLNNHKYITFNKKQRAPSDIRVTLTGQGMIRGGSLSFIEQPQKPVGLPIELQIHSQSSQVKLQGDILTINLGEIVDFTYISTTPAIKLPSNSLLNLIQTPTQIKQEKQGHKNEGLYTTTYVMQATFCGQGYFPSAVVYDENQLGYSQSLQINVPCSLQADQIED